MKPTWQLLNPSSWELFQKLCDAMYPLEVCKITPCWGDFGSLRSAPLLCCNFGLHFRTQLAVDFKSRGCIFITLSFSLLLFFSSSLLVVGASARAGRFFTGTLYCITSYTLFGGGLESYKQASFPNFMCVIAEESSRVESSRVESSWVESSRVE